MDVYQNLTSYFKEQIINSTTKQNIKTYPLMNQYLAELLNRHNEFNIDSMFAIEFLKGTNYNKLADTILFTLGFFDISLSYNNSNYYNTLGSTSYKLASNELIDPNKANMFLDFSSRFDQLVNILKYINYNQQPISNKELITLYSSFLKSNSSSIKQILVEQNIIISDQNNKLH